MISITIFIIIIAALVIKMSLIEAAFGARAYSYKQMLSRSAIQTIASAIILTTVFTFPILYFVWPYLIFEFLALTTMYSVFGHALGSYQIERVDHIHGALRSLVAIVLSYQVFQVIA